MLPFFSPTGLSYQLHKYVFHGHKKEPKSLTENTFVMSRFVIRTNLGHFKAFFGNFYHDPKAIPFKVHIWGAPESLTVLSEFGVKRLSNYSNLFLWYICK